MRTQTNSLATVVLIFFFIYYNKRFFNIISLIIYNEQIAPKSREFQTLPCLMKKNHFFSFSFIKYVSFKKSVSTKDQIKQSWSTNLGLLVESLHPQSAISSYNFVYVCPYIKIPSVPKYNPVKHFSGHWVWVVFKRDDAHSSLLLL